MMQLRWNVCSLLIAATLMTGCAHEYRGKAYEGTLPSSETALLHVSPEARLVAIDGKPVHGVPATLGGGQRTVRSFEDKRLVQLRAGPSLITVGYSPYFQQEERFDAFGGSSLVTSTYNGSAENEVIQFIVEAQHEYVLKLKVKRTIDGDPESWTAVVLDLSKSSKPVSEMIRRVPDGPIP
ncbi:MAG TPA: hypothetical protein VF669_01990 [Tepidisphaeraceae bacterium]|jgi:hypothetical protein